VHSWPTLDPVWPIEERSVPQSIVSFALERLHALDSAPALASTESRLLYRFPTPDLHGRTELLLTPLKLLAALAKFVPPAAPR